MSIPPAPVAPAIVDQIQALLANGPVLIGESHSKQDARLAIKVLIGRHAVTRLSIELPVAPAPAAPAGHVQNYGNYFGLVSEVANSYVTLNALTDFAIQAGVQVYFHDMPAKLTALRSMDPNYIAHASQFGQLTARFEQHKIGQLNERNQYAAGYLHSQLGANVATMAGLAILAGDDHLDPAVCANNTIQAILNIPANRVFHLA